MTTGFGVGSYWKDFTKANENQWRIHSLYAWK